MAYKPKKGGYKHRQLIADGRSATREQRAIIERIITRPLTNEELFQLLTKLSLLSSRLDDILDDLDQYEI